MTDAFDQPKAIDGARTHDDDGRQNDDCVKMRGFLDQSGDGFRIFDMKTQRYTYINAAAGRLMDCSVAELSGFSLEEVKTFVHPDDMAKMGRRWQALVTGRSSSYDVEYRWRCKDGSYRWLHDHTQVIRDATGAPATLISTSRDISERKRMEADLKQALALSDERLRELQAVITSIPDGLVIFNSQGRAIFYNDLGRQVTESLGFSIDEPIFGRPVPTHLYHDGRPIGNIGKSRLSEGLRKGETVRDFIVESRRDPERPVLYSLSSAATYDTRGRISGVAITFRDVTEADAAQRLVQESRAQALALVEKLQDEDRNRTQFLGILSHELRNPLATIMMSLALQNHGDVRPDQSRKAREVAQRQLEHLTRLVDDLLDVTRIRENKITLKLQHIELIDFLRRHIQDYQVFFDEHEVGLTLLLPETAVAVEADPARLNQVLGNLLYNAGKFTASGGRVTVRLGVDEPSREAVIEISDTGMGIDRETLNRIFEPFTQADRSLHRSLGGLGLGLSIVKGMVELHGGHVQAFSEGVGLGSTFTIRLPLSAPGKVQDHTARRKDMAKSTETLKVLVIEDNPDLLEILGDLVMLLGHEVATATSGREGLEVAMTFRPDVITCDIGLPDISGYEVAKRVRNDPELKGTLLIAMSGYAQPEDLDRSKAAGFNRHLAKPVSIDTLSEAIRECQRILLEQEQEQELGQA